MAIVIVPDLESTIPPSGDESPIGGVKGHGGNCVIVMCLRELKHGIPGLKVPDFHHLGKGESRVVTGMFKQKVK